MHVVKNVQADLNLWQWIEKLKTTQLDNQAAYKPGLSRTGEKTRPADVDTVARGAASYGTPPYQTLSHQHTGLHAMVADAGAAAE